MPGAGVEGGGNYEEANSRGILPKLLIKDITW